MIPRKEKYGKMPPNICHHGVQDEEKENLCIHILSYPNARDSLAHIIYLDKSHIIYLSEMSPLLGLLMNYGQAAAS